MIICIPFTGIAWRTALVSALALLLWLGASFRPAQPEAHSASPTRQTPTHYTFTLDVDYDKAFLNVEQTIAHRAEFTLTSLIFNVPPAAPAFAAFNLSSATLGATPVSFKQTGIVLEIPLPQPVAAGQSISVTLRWWGQVPFSDGRYGAADGVILLGNWYPQLAVMRQGVWQQHQYTSIGDAFFTDVADFDVTVTTAANVTIAASGQQTGRKSGQWTFRAESARDFALALSSRFQTQSRKVDGVPLTVYFTGERAEAARVALDVAEQSLRWYVQRLGPYRFPALAIVQSPNGQQKHNAQEHSGLFSVRAEVFTPSTVGVYVAHELAHAWFFASVGNDQIRQPWLDEALATSVSLDFYRDMNAREYAALWGVWGGATKDFNETAPLNRGIMDFDNGSAYFWTIYRQGASFMRDVREAMGDDAYWRALRAYADDFAFAVAEPQDLLRALRQAAPQADLLPIFRRYLDYDFLKYASLDVGIGGEEGALWQGTVQAPITVTAESPTLTVTVYLDGKVMTTTNGALTATIDTQTLADGAHTLAVKADDQGLNRKTVERTFRVSHPTPTATPSPTAEPGATAQPTARPSATPPASPTATPPNAPAATTTTAVPLPQWQSIAAAAAILAAALLLFARTRRKRRRW